MGVCVCVCVCVGVCVGMYSLTSTLPVLDVGLSSTEYPVPNTGEVTSPLLGTSSTILFLQSSNLEKEEERDVPRAERGT